MFKVLKSSVDKIPDYNKKVADFAAELTAWKQHHAKVGVDPEYHPYPAPSAPEIIASAVAPLDRHENVFTSAYEIEDDSPAPEVVLRAKKNRLFSLATLEERNAEQKILPVGKVRLANIRKADIGIADAKRLTEIVDAENARRADAIDKLVGREPPGIIKKIGAMLTGAEVDPVVTPEQIEEAVGRVLTQEDLAAKVRDARPPSDTAFLDTHATRVEALLAVHRHFAQVQDEIEDLDADTIDGYTIPPVADA